MQMDSDIEDRSRPRRLLVEVLTWVVTIERRRSSSIGMCVEAVFSETQLEALLDDLLTANNPSNNSSPPQFRARLPSRRRQSSNCKFQGQAEPCASMQ